MPHKLDCGCYVKRKPEIHKCSDCGMSLCGKHIYFYVDESNIAITKNAKGYCKECYLKRHEK